MLQGYTSAIITAHTRYARPAHVGKSWPLALLQELQNSGSQMIVLRVKPCQHRSPLTFSAAMKKLVFQSTDWLSAIQYGRVAAECFSILL